MTEYSTGAARYLVGSPPDAIHLPARCPASCTELLGAPVVETTGAPSVDRSDYDPW